MNQLIVQAMSKTDIYEITNSIRKTLKEGLNYENPLYFPIVEFIEILPFIDTSFSYDYVSDNELPNAYAQYIPLENVMRIRETVYDNAIKNNGRDRFTLAHELGHYILHSDIDSLSFARSLQKVPAYRDPEWQANTFASMLLMNPQYIKDLTVPQIAGYCRTSLQAAEVALNNAKKSNYIH